MTIIVHVELRGVTADQYDAVRRECGWVDRHPVGGFAHLTWFDGDVNYNIDAWESEAAFAAFAEQRLGPAMAAAGVAVEPVVTMHPAHEVFLPEARTVLATPA